MVHSVLTVILALLFSVTGGVKLASVPASLAIRDSLKLSPGFWKVAGTLEWLGAIGLVVGAWVPMLGVAAAVGLTGLMGGAIVSRLKVGLGLGGVAVDVVVAAMAAATAYTVYTGQ
jgi:hypothetical protein